MVHPKKRCISTLTSVCITLLLLGSVGRPVHGQEMPEGWSAPLNLSQSNTPSMDPSVAVDPAGGVHVIWSEETGDNDGAILYTHLEGDAWTAPVDVLLNPGGGVPQRSVLAAGPEGTLHVVWRGRSAIYHSAAYAPDAGRAEGWREPQALLPAGRQDIGDPALVVDGAGTPHVVYTEQIGDNSGVYYARTTADGRWYDPLPIYRNYAFDRMVDRPAIAIDPAGTLHVVWVEYDYPETYPPLGIRYAYSDDGGASWSEPFSLADGPYDYPALALRGEDEVHVVWSGTLGDRFKFHRWSADGGQTWSALWRDAEAGGFLRKASLVTDGDGVLHWLQAVDEREEGDVLYYNTWQGDQWSPGVILLKDSVAEQNPSHVSAAVALGNELHVVLQVPVALQREGYQADIFYLHKQLDAAGQPAQALARPPTTAPATVTAAPAGPGEVAASATAAQTTPAVEVPLGSEPALPETPWYAVTIGLLPVIVLLGVLVIVYVIRLKYLG